MEKDQQYVSLGLKNIDDSVALSKFEGLERLMFQLKTVSREDKFSLVLSFVLFTAVDEPYP